MGEQDDRRVSATNTRARGPTAGTDRDQLPYTRSMVAFRPASGSRMFTSLFIYI